MVQSRNRTRSTGKKPVHRKPVPPKLQTQLLAVLEWRETDTGEDLAYTVADRILDAIRHNLTQREAAAAAGVPEVTLKNWLRRGAEVARERASMAAGELEYRQPRKTEEAFWWFWQELQVAEAQAEHRLVASLDAIATGEGMVNEVVTERVDSHGNTLDTTTKRSAVAPNPQAAQWLLARRHPERWANTETLEVVGGKNPVEVHHTVSSPQLESLIDQIRERHLNPIDTTVAETPELGSGD